MTLQEFKAWFEGFTEDMSAAPNKKQWERIKARVKEIDGAVTTYPVFVDRYWPPYPRQVFGQWQNPCQIHNANAAFNSSQAMLTLGKADYQSIG